MQDDALNKLAEAPPQTAVWHAFEGGINPAPLTIHVLTWFDERFWEEHGDRRVLSAWLTEDEAVAERDRLIGPYDPYGYKKLKYRIDKLNVGVACAP
jgi:hypothetical protein